ncbi:MAG TPA: pre-peptidase C-terminal domain-containing protein [Casimicrobiaceae bacterium]
MNYQVVVPAGSTYARFSLFNATMTPDSDLDLEVRLNGTLVGASGGGTSDEEVNLVNPAAGTYEVRVVGFATPSPSSTFTLFNWVLGSTSAGNMTVRAPATAVLGTTGVLNLSFSGLTVGTKYLGSVAYSGVAGLPNPTIVRVDP